MIRVRQRWFLGLIAALFCACVVLLPLRAPAQSQRETSVYITPITDFTSIHDKVMGVAKRSDRFEIDLHLELGANRTDDGKGVTHSSTPDQFPEGLLARDFTGSKIVLIVGKWLDLPRAALILRNHFFHAQPKSSHTVIAVVTDAKDHLVEGKLLWPKSANLASPSGVVQWVYAPTDLGGPERVASSANTLYLAAAQHKRCVQAAANVWPASPAGSQSVTDQKLVGFGATTELLLRSSALVNTDAMRARPSLVIHLPKSFAVDGARAYSEFSSTNQWLETSVAERVTLGLVAGVLPMPKHLDVRVNVPFGHEWQQVSELDRSYRYGGYFLGMEQHLLPWEEFRADHLGRSGAPSYLLEPMAPADAKSIFVNGSAHAQAYGRFVGTLASEVQERALPTAALSFGSKSGSQTLGAVIPVSVPQGVVVVTFKKYRERIRALEKMTNVIRARKTVRPH